MKTKIDIKEFESEEQARQYLKAHGIDAERIRVGIEKLDGPKLKAWPNERVRRHSPDIPINRVDLEGLRTHQVLWLVDQFGDGERFMSNYDVGRYSNDETLTMKRVSPNTNALRELGCLEGVEPFGPSGLKWYRMTEKGQRALDNWGRPHVEEAFFEDIDRLDLAGGNALEDDW